MNQETTVMKLVSLDMTTEVQPNESSIKLVDFLMNQKDISVFLKDKDRRYLECNLKFLNQSGLSSLTDLSGKSDYDLIWTMEEAGIYRLGDKEVIESGKAKLNIIETQTNSTGHLRWIETSKFPLLNSKNQVVGVIGYYHDQNELYNKVTKHCCRILKGLD